MSLVVGDLVLEVRHSARRRSLQITVDRGGELIVTAPAGCPVTAMMGFVREKRSWIYTKLAEKDALSTPPRVRQIASGEGFPYLGRSYRMLLVGTQSAPVRLEGGRFRLCRANRNEGRELMVQWYIAHARPWMERRVEMLAPRIGVRPGAVQVKDLGYRWGSCGRGARLYFHWKSILLPPGIVEYIVAHELVHLREPHHTPAFWAQLERAMPDAVGRRRWLSESAAGVVGV